MNSLDKLLADEPSTPPARGKTRPDRAEVIGDDGRWLASWALRLIILCAAGYVISLGIGKLWTGLLPSFLSLLLCTVLWPVVRLLRFKLHLPNALAVVITLFGAFGVIGGIIASMAPAVAGQSRTMFDRAVAGVHTLQTWVKGPPLNLKANQFETVVNEAVSKLQEKFTDIASSVASGVSTASEVLVTLAITIVLTFFFLKDGPKFLPWLRGIVGENVGLHLTEVLTRTWNTLAGYIRAQAAVSFIDAVCIGIGLGILHVPLAFVLATLTFIAGFIPIIGAVSAGVISILVALVSNGVTTAIIVTVLILLVQQLEGHILQPIFQSKAMDLHPAIILLSVAVGSSLYGIVGAFLAVPVAAAFAVWFRYHKDLVSLRTGELTVDEMELATAADSPSMPQFREILGKFNFRLGSNDSDNAAGDDKEPAQQEAPEK